MAVAQWIYTPGSHEHRQRSNVWHYGKATMSMGPVLNRCHLYVVYESFPANVCESPQGYYQEAQGETVTYHTNPTVWDETRVLPSMGAGRRT